MNVIGISGLDRSISFKKREIPGLPSRFCRLAQGLDSAAALVSESGIEAAAAEERFTGCKGTNSFPVNAIQYCLAASRLSIEQVDFVAHSFSYESHRSFFESHDSGFFRIQFEEVYSRLSQLECLSEHFPGIDWDPRFVGVPHHLAHAASAFFPSGFEDALVLVVDGMGERHSITVAIGHGKDLTVLCENPAPHSLGLLYSVFTIYLGFQPALDEYKVMGLAPYGDPGRYFQSLAELVRLKENGTLTIPVLLCNETLREQETFEGTLSLIEERFGPGREPGAPIEQRHCDLAAALQSVLQQSLLHVLTFFRKETSQRYLCLAGGVALNCTANGVILRSRLFDRMFVQPASGDDGTALGAALYAQYNRDPDFLCGKMTMPLWGPSFDRETVRAILNAGSGYTFRAFDATGDLFREVAERLAAGQIIGWFQGRMEYGPRALGGRSILADPHDPAMRDRVNERIKKREGFRPFAPAVREEETSRYFEIGEDEVRTHAHMLYTVPVREAFRSQLPSVTHVDGSARVQVVVREHQPRFWSLLGAFGERTGLPVLLNTSFNVRGQPIVCTPNDAIETFLAAGLDALVIEDFLVLRSP